MLRIRGVRNKQKLTPHNKLNIMSVREREVWMVFFNEEAEEVLAEYLAKCRKSPQYFRKVRVFNPSKNPTMWNVASARDYFGKQLKACFRFC